MKPCCSRKGRLEKHIEKLPHLRRFFLETVISPVRRAIFISQQSVIQFLGTVHCK